MLLSSARNALAATVTADFFQKHSMKRFCPHFRAISSILTNQVHKPAKNVHAFRRKRGMALLTPLNQGDMISNTRDFGGTYVETECLAFTPQPFPFILKNTTSGISPPAVQHSGFRNGNHIRLQYIPDYSQSGDAVQCHDAEADGKGNECVL